MAKIAWSGNSNNHGRLILSTLKLKKKHKIKIGMMQWCNSLKKRFMIKVPFMFSKVHSIYLCSSECALSSRGIYNSKWQPTYYTCTTLCTISSKQKMRFINFYTLLSVTNVLLLLYQIVCYYSKLYSPITSYLKIRSLLTKAQWVVWT